MSLIIPANKAEGGKIPDLNILDDFWMGEHVPLEALPEPERFNVLIKQVNIKKVTAKGILIPETVQSDQQWSHGMGLVVKVGPSVFRGTKFLDVGLTPEMGPAPGDIYWFQARAPMRLFVDDELYMLLADDGLLAKFDRKQLSRVRFT